MKELCAKACTQAAALTMTIQEEEYVEDEEYDEEDDEDEYDVEEQEDGDVEEGQQLLLGPSVYFVDSSTEEILRLVDLSGCAVLTACSSASLSAYFE